MPKKIVEDVLPPKRSIRNIPLPGGKSRKEPERTPVRRIPEAKVPPRKPEPRSKRVGRNYTRITLWSLVIICLVVLGFALSFIFVSATISIKPKEWTLPIQLDLEARSDSANEGLLYSLVTVSDEMQVEVPATGEERVERKASGKITIFNSHSSASQALVANTRFETPAGLIFRIDKPVTVPGTSKKTGVTVPGSVTVTVFADKPGPSYNVGLADFTIPGFKGDAKFKNITAKSDPGSPIAGGFVGTVKKVSDNDLNAAYADLENNLRTSLSQQSNAQVPPTHVLFPSATQISFEKSPAEQTDDPLKAVVKEKGTLTGVIFEKSRLIEVISKLFPEEFADMPVEIRDWSGITFEFKNSKDRSALEDVIRFSLAGNAVVTSIVNKPALQSELISKRRADFNAILSGIKTIERAELRIRPAWATKMPKNPEKIVIEEI